MVKKTISCYCPFKLVTRSLWFAQEEEQEGKMARLEAELAERDKEVEHLKAAAAEEGQVSEHLYQGCLSAFISLDPDPAFEAEYRSGSRALMTKN
jgi:hypothetical protein